MATSTWEHFSVLPDPRTQRNRLHLSDRARSHLGRCSLTATTEFSKTRYNMLCILQSAQMLSSPEIDRETGAAGERNTLVNRV